MAEGRTRGTVVARVCAPAVLRNSAATRHSSTTDRGWKMLCEPMEDYGRDYTELLRLRNFHQSCRGSTESFGDRAIAKAPELFDGDDHLFIRLKPALRRTPQPDTLRSSSADNVAHFKRREA